MVAKNSNNHQQEVLKGFLSAICINTFSKSKPIKLRLRTQLQADGKLRTLTLISSY